jgi:HEPN domain-containing protein
MSCKQTCWLAGAAVHAQQAGVGKLVKAAVGGKLHKRGGKTHFPHEL